MRNRLRGRNILNVSFLFLSALIAVSTGATAQDAHWEYKERGDYNYNDARNWYPQQVPTGTAEFPYNNFSIYLNISTTIGTWKFTEFSPSKQPLKFTNGENNQIGALTFTGQGIINDGDSANNTKAIIQNNSQATLNFTNGSVAGTRSCASYYGCTQINNSGYLYFREPRTILAFGDFCLS